MSAKKSIFLISDIALTLLLVLADQYTKRLATAYLRNRPAVPLIPGVLELSYLENRGAAFGLLQNQKVFFVLTALLILCAIVYCLLRMPLDRKYVILHFVLVMVASGACGNLIDRVRTDYVVDFIYFVLIDFPIFNMADIYVTVSTAVFVLLLLFYYKENDFSFLSLRQPEDRD